MNMEMTMMKKQEKSLTPLDSSVIFVFLGAFVWLRWWSGLSENHGSGLALGALFAVIFLARNLRKTRYFMRRKRSDFFASILRLAFGAFPISTLLRGHGWFDDKSGDAGCVGLALPAFGIRQANPYRSSSRDNHRDGASSDWKQR